jgi:hypothetical protein
VSHPIGDFADDPERITGAVGLRRIAGEFLVRQAGIVFERAGGLHDVDPAPPLPCRQFRSPGGRVQGGWRAPIEDHSVFRPKNYI